MKSQSLESQILEKLNKILEKKSLKIKIQEDGCVVMFIRLNRDWARIQSACWKSLKMMLFENNDEYTIFNDIKDKRDYVGLQAFRDLGLTCLEKCASWEEMLIRLEIMFPDF